MTKKNSPDIVDILRDVDHPEKDPILWTPVEKGAAPEAKNSILSFTLRVNMEKLLAMSLEGEDPEDARTRRRSILDESVRRQEAYYLLLGNLRATLESQGIYAINGGGETYRSLEENPFHEFPIVVPAQYAMAVAKLIDPVTREKGFIEPVTNEGLLPNGSRPAPATADQLLDDLNLRMLTAAEATKKGEKISNLSRKPPSRGFADREIRRRSEQGPFGGETLNDPT